MPAMSDLKNGLGKKIGPLKAWQWGLVIGGGFIVYKVMSGKGFSLGGSATQEEPTDLGVMGGSSGTYAGPGMGGSDNGAAPTVTVQIVGGAEGDTTAADTAEADAAAQARIAQLEANVAYQKRRVSDWSAWGAKWKTQAKKNAARAAKRSSGTKPKTKRVSTPKAKPVAKKRMASAKRNQTNRRTIAPKIAAKKTLRPKTPAKKKKG